MKGLSPREKAHNALIKSGVVDRATKAGESLHAALARFLKRPPTKAEWDLIVSRVMWAGMKG